MANIVFSRKQFEEDFGKLDESMQTKIAMLGTTLERFDNEEMEIEVFPNRPDLLSYQGFKRALLAFLGKKTGLQEYKINNPEEDFKVKIDKSVKTVRPFTACAIVKELDFNNKKIQEIIDIQEKLHTTVGRNRKKVAIGIYPLEKIKLPIIYGAEQPEKIKFIPLESKGEMTGRQILSKHPTGRDYAPLLSEAKVFPIFRDANNEVLSMPPIINSELTGKIDENTKDVFIECSGHDFNVLNKVLNIIITTFAELGGKVYAMNLDFNGKKQITPDLTPEKLKINIKDAEKLLGIELNEKQVAQLLGKMGYNYEKGEVEIPAWRVDILHPNDIYEDIAIAYGYDKFVPEIPNISTAGQESDIEIKKRKIAEILVGLGLLETSSFHLTTKKEIKRTNHKAKDFTEVLDSKTEYNTLRQNLLTNLMKILSENTNAQYPQKIFELGTVFQNLKEKEKLCITISGETDFTEIKQVLEYLMKSLDLNFKIEETTHASFIDGRTAKILVSEKEVGFLGEISPTVLKNWNLKMPSVALEIEIEGL